MNTLRTIQVTTAYFENYNWDGDVPYYKIKGAHTFELDVDLDDLIYREEELRAYINDMIVEDTNPNGSPLACKYIIIDITIKDEVTRLPFVTSSFLDHYRPTSTNRINPGLCSPAAKDYLMDRCREDQLFRDRAIDYRDIKNCM